MKTIHLNIGLNITGGGVLTLAEVQSALADHDFIITRSRVAQSSTEQTLCCSCATDSAIVKFRVHNLSVALQQEAIAWIDDSGTGHVTGPLAAGWGAFNPSEFLPVVEPNPALENFKAYLRGTIIPDSIESGFDGYAEDLQTALDFLNA